MFQQIILQKDSFRLFHWIKYCSALRRSNLQFYEYRFEIALGAASESTKSTHDCGDSCNIKGRVVRMPAGSAMVKDVQWLSFDWNVT